MESLGGEDVIQFHVCPSSSVAPSDFLRYNTLAIARLGYPSPFDDFNVMDEVFGNENEKLFSSSLFKIIGLCSLRFRGYTSPQGGQTGNEFAHVLRMCL